MSAEFVQEIVLWVYKLALRGHYILNDLFSFEDVKFTVKVILALFFIFLVTLILGDALFLMLAMNAWLLWPLAYQKKRAEIDRVMGIVNH